MRGFIVAGEHAPTILSRHPDDLRIAVSYPRGARRPSEYVFVGSELGRSEEPRAGQSRPLAATPRRPSHSAGQAEGRVRSHYPHIAYIHLRAHVYSSLPDDAVVPCLADIRRIWQAADAWLLIPPLTRVERFALTRRR